VGDASGEGLATGICAAPLEQSTSVSKNNNSKCVERLIIGLL